MKSDDSQTAIALVDPIVGSIFDKRFRVEERIAAGGFGAIYRARHVKSGHPIALKILHPTLASDLGVLARFRREGTTLTSLRNPHTITAYEFGQADKMLFIVMELLHGKTLFDHYSDGGPLEWKRVVHIAKQVCESLEEAHALGIVHRDLKPTNIHLEDVDGDPDFVKVLDFGIAKILRGSDLDASDITNVGQMIGTLDYMSPEQMVGGQVTGQTDIYTLGIVMYEMIAGERPFPESQTAGAALAAMLKTTPEPLYLRAPIPRPLDAIVMRCLERETTKRFRSVGELRAELARVLEDISTTATVQLQSSDKTPVRRASADDDDDTAVTPPPERILDPSRPNPRPVPEWDDDDERAPTTTRRPDGADVVGRELQHEKSGNVPALRGAGIPPRPQPRPLESRHVSTPVPQVVVAPFSQKARVRPADAGASGDIELGNAPTAAMDIPAKATTDVGYPPAPVPATRSLAPHAPVSTTTPLPGASMGFPSTQLGHSPAPSHGLSEPPTRRGTAAYDMSQLAAREAAVRRLVWLIVLVVAAGVGFVLATQL